MFTFAAAAFVVKLVASTARNEVMTSVRPERVSTLLIGPAHGRPVHALIDVCRNYKHATVVKLK